MLSSTHTQRFWGAPWGSLDPSLQTPGIDYSYYTFWWILNKFTTHEWMHVIQVRNDKRGNKWFPYVSYFGANYSFKVLLRVKTDITACNIQQDKVCMNGASIRQMVVERSEDVRESLWKRSDRKRGWSGFLALDVFSWYLWLWSRSHETEDITFFISSGLFLLCLIIFYSIFTVSL